MTVTFPPANRRFAVLRKYAARSLLALVTLVLVVLGALVLALHADTTRVLVARKLSESLSDLLVGELQFGAITELGPSITIENFAVMDGSGQPVLRVAKLHAVLDLRALLSGNVVIERATIERPWVSLHSRGDSLALVDAFALAHDDGEQASEGGTFLLEIHSGVLREGQVVAAPAELSVAALNVDFELSLSDAFRMDVSSLRARVARGEAARIELGLAQISLKLGAGETSRIQATVRAGSDTLQLTGELGWGESGPQTARATLGGGISTSGLEAVGEPTIAALLATHVQVQVSAEMEEAGERLSLESVFHTSAGDLRLDATREGARYTALVRSTELALSKLLTREGLESAAFDLSATAVEDASHDFAVTLDSGPLRYGELALPAWNVQGKVSSTRARLLSLAIPAWTGERDKLAVDVDVQYTGEIRGTVDLHLAQVSFQQAAASVGELDAKARVHGSIEHPVVDAQLSARDLNFGENALDSCELSVRGGPRRYALRLAAVAGEVRASGSYDVQLLEVGQEVSGSTEVSGWLDHPLRIEIPQLRVRPEAVELRGVRIASGPASIAVDGRYGFTGASDLRAKVTNLSLAEVVAHLPITASPALTGRGSASLTLRGVLERPELSAGLELADVTLDGAALGTLKVSAELTSRQPKLSLDLAFDGAQDDKLQTNVQGALGTKGSLVQRIETGDYVVKLSGQQDLSRLAPVWKLAALDPPPRGHVALDGHFAGTIERPEGELNMKVRGFALAELPPIDAELGVELGKERSWAALRAEDSTGTRASAVVEVKTGIRQLVRDLTVQSVATTPGSLQLDLQVPRLDRLPTVIAVDLPVRVSAQAVLTTAHDAPPRAQLTLQTKWEENQPDAAGTGASELPELRLTAELQRSKVRVDLTGELAGKPVMHASVSGDAPVHEWLRKQNYVGNLAFELTASALDLAALPRNAKLVSGQLDGSVRGTGLLTKAPRVDADMRIADLRIAEGQPEDIALVANARPDGATLKATVHEGSREALLITAQLPWSWDGAAVLTPDLSRFQASLQLSAMPLASLLASVPGLAQPRGSADGKLEVRGLEDDYDLRGRIVVKQAAFTLEDPLMRFDKLDASIRVDPKIIEVESLRFADQEGVLTGSGSVTLDRLVPTSARVSLRAKSLPLRRDTLVIATVDAVIEAKAHLASKERQSATVSLRDVAVRLPDQGAHRAQELEAHPDVLFTDAPVVAESEQKARTSTVPLEVEIDASQPFWVRHMDFAMQLAAKLRFRVDSDGTRLAGPVRIQRGFLSLLGKGFELERGLIVFDGSQEIDPTLTIDAVHKLSDGETVTVKVRGRVSAPTLSFTSSVQGATGDAEALQLLVSGRDNSAAETASAQVGAALAGLTAGLLSKLTRNKYGKYVPVLALEAGASSGTRIRAGVEANELIPPFLRDVVQGVYVEGYMGSQNEGGSRQGTGGVLLELYFPQDIVTGGTWEVPNNWAVEVTWEP